MENILEIEDLTKDYETGFWIKKKHRALDALTLNVKPGQIFGFLGGNGAGKTTTIKILMSLMFPTSGTARILGSDISDVKMHQRIGYCPENPYFYDYLTAAELMNYFGELFGLSAADARAKTADLLDRVGIAEKDRKRQLRKFSKGMQQRVGLAQALINDPEIVFLDEPMSGLDPIGRREIRQLIEDLNANGTSIFMSTHILSDIEAMCSEVAILKKGKLSATGKLDDLLAAESGEKIFEIILKGIDAETLQNALSDAGSFDVSQKQNGVSVETADERNIEEILKRSHLAGATLVSVNHLKNSLEELFADKN